MLSAVVGGGARLIAIGIGIGSVASVALRRVVPIQIVDVPVFDPAVALALVLFALVGLTACLVPGLRATRLDPIRALHQD